ncbi:MAG TPA: DMT family transporter [Candidatus Dormibacteraeota bacterium]|nr:DMT family transporter [Candidatus Dormibacteraeota bacterium]
MGPRILVLLGAVLLSTGGAAIKLCGMGGWQVAGLRSAVAVLAVLALARPARRDFDRATWSVSVAFAATLIVFVVANKLTTAANAIFLQSTAPLYILLLAPRLLGEHLQRRDVAVMIAMAIGLTMFFVGEQPSFASAPEPVRGNLVAALSGVTWALTVLGMRWQSRAGGGPGAMLLLGNLLACLVCLPLAWPLAAAAVGDWALIAYLGIFQIVAAYLLVSAGLRHLTALEGMLLLLLEPVLNPVWAALVEGEVPGALSLAGGAVILGATVWKTVADAR